MVSKSNTPKKRDSAATRERIMQAGMAEFGTKGYDGARTEDIAKKSQCNIRMLYHYYGGKKNLYMACLERVYSNIREQEEKLNLLEMEPLEAIEQLVRFTFNHMHKNPDFVNLVGVENTQRGKFIKELPQLANAADSLINTISEVLDRGEAKGVFRKDIDAFQLYISILSLGYLHLSNRFTLSQTYSRNLDSEVWLNDRLEHVLALVLSYVKADMINQNQDILARALAWIGKGHQVLLYTVVNTWGSSPRPPGSIMILRDDGHVAGSVSGGCIEDDLIRQVRDQGIPEKPSIISYGVKADEARRFGLPCGGTMRLVQEPLVSAETIESIKQLLDRLDQGEITCRTLDFNTAGVALRKADEADVLACDESQFTHVFGPRYRLLIIGAGQIGELLSQIALSLDFEVTICDPREEYHAEWAIENTHLVRTMPDDTVVAMKMDSRTAVVALTHDPKLDDMALMEALNSPAFYIGALGSKVNNDKRRERLLEFDLTEQQIAQLHGPAGLGIGSHTPAEIAVSIAAEIVAVKNKAAM